jgi:hypothetical protein
LERDQVEEAAAVLEGNPMLHLDQASRSAPILKDALLDLHRPIRRADQ